MRVRRQPGRTELGLGVDALEPVRAGRGGILAGSLAPRPGFPGCFRRPERPGRPRRDQGRDPGP